MEIDALTEARFEARAAAEDVACWRDSLMPELFPSGNRPSDATAIAFAVQAIRHSRRVAPENPLGVLGRADVTSDNAVAVLRAVIADLRALRNADGDRLALVVGDLLDKPL